MIVISPIYVNLLWISRVSQSYCNRYGVYVAAEARNDVPRHNELARWSGSAGGHVARRLGAVAARRRRSDSDSVVVVVGGLRQCDARAGKCSIDRRARARVRACVRSRITAGLPLTASVFGTCTWTRSLRWAAVAVTTHRRGVICRCTSLPTVERLSASV